MFTVNLFVAVLGLTKDSYLATLITVTETRHRRPRLAEAKNWVTIFKAAKKPPSPYYVAEVHQDMVKKFSELLRPLYKKGCPFPTRPIRDLIFDQGEGSGTVGHRESWNGILDKTNLIIPTRKNNFRRCTAAPTGLYKERQCIYAAKYKDLQVLKKFSTDQAFYDALPYDDKVPDEVHDDAEL
ncbi:hypothetical protein RRG08_006554 [Elysia crispata]|uniref:Uncharacterized protein n=1 Tax=Elysia crispata TaxID=231223 RepID=A0AAE0YBP7_9GAST|nr:hypothetical protein RRG08_006554 [Elysia crispata]